jgi:predicted GIY-YIG superfamily endonuclease
MAAQRLSLQGGRLATYYIYIMTNRTRRLYIGVTNDLHRRVYEHKHRLVHGFTSKYFLERLVYFEESDDVGAAIARLYKLQDRVGRWRGPGFE